MPVGIDSYNDANESGVGWGAVDYSDPYYGDVMDIPNGAQPQYGSYPNAGPSPTYSGQGGVQVGGTLNIGLGRGAGVTVSGGTRDATVPYNPYPGVSPYGRQSFLGGNALILLIVAVGIFVILR